MHYSQFGFIPIDTLKVLDYVHEYPLVKYLTCYSGQSGSIMTSVSPKKPFCLFRQGNVRVIIVYDITGTCYLLSANILILYLRGINVFCGLY